MDIKAVDGLRGYAEWWPGPIRCISRAADTAAIGYGKWYRPDELPFELVCIPAQATPAAIAENARDAAILILSDGHLDIGVVDLLPPGTVVMTLEYTLQTRLMIARLASASLLQRAKTSLWLLWTERRRRHAIRHAAAIQANGRPAYDAYAPIARDAFLYFDTRLRRKDFIGEAAQAKIARAKENRPLRLAFSGRLEAMKGADHLVPVMKALHERWGSKATLDIYGDGVLRARIGEEAEQAGLKDAITLHGPVDFERELIPTMKERIDLFLCCHRQPDPSCTYLETLGCGVPIAGYLNDAFKGVLELGPCGVGAAMDDFDKLAAAIAALERNREELARLTEGAAKVAENRVFETEFADRSAHLLEVAARRGISFSPRPPMPAAAAGP